MLLYYYYTNSKYSRLLVNEIDYIFKLYKTYHKVRVTDESSLKYTVGNLLFNISRLLLNSQDTLLIMKDAKFFIEGVKVNGKKCKIKVSYVFFNKLLKVLEAENYLSVIVGGQHVHKEFIDSYGELHKIPTGNRTSSKLIINNKFADLLKNKTITYELENVLILRDEEKNDMEYKPTPLQIQQIDFLKGYNRHLKDFTFKDKDENVIAEPFLRRIFNTSFEMGGRFYTQQGAIQTMTSEDRLKITINGSKVAEIDATALHPNILASRDGIRIDYDPYDFDVPAEIDYAAIEAHKIKYGRDQYNPVRNLNKICVLLAFNNRSRGATIQSISRKLRDDKLLPEESQMYYGINFLDVNQLYSNMENRNIDISENFGANAGAFLQFLDSMWMERVLSYMIQMNCPAIPVHDSIVCPVEFVDQVCKAMTLAYEQSFGDAYNLKLKIKRN